MVSTITQFQLLDVVALKHDLPEQGLTAGQVGTLVEPLAPDVFEVEFSDDNGQTYAQLPLHTDQLLKLYYSPHPVSVSFTAMENTIHQYGQGDNVAGDKVMGNKVGTHISNSNIGNVVNDAKDNAQITASNFTQTSGTDTAELLQLIASLRQTVAQLPPETQEDLIIEIDDVEAEITKPAEQRNVPRLRKRLTALIVGASAAAIGLSNGLEVANNLADQAIALGDKVGLELQLPPAP
jgi:hypothetical protein